MTDKPLPRREAWLLARRKKRRRVLLWQVGLLLEVFTNKNKDARMLKNYYHQLKQK